MQPDPAAAAIVGTLAREWLALIPLAIVWAGMAGWLARGAGLANIFRDDDHIVYVTDPDCRLPRSVPVAARRRRPFLRVLRASPAFWSHVGLAVLAGYTWTAMRVPTPCPSGCGPAARLAGALPGAAEVAAFALVAGAIGVIASNVTLVRARLDIPPPERRERRAELVRCSLGVAVGTVAMLLIHAAAESLAASEADGLWTAPLTALHLMIVLIVAIALGVRFLTPSLALIALLGLVAALTALAGAFAASWGQGVVLGLAALVVWANGRAYKAQIPGLDYAEIVNIAAVAEAQAKQAGDGETRRSVPKNPEKLAALDVLRKWHEAQVRRGREKPLLVLLATSGGAYRASYWTALVLDRIAAESGPGQRFEGLPGNLRMIAGASGGMVAGAYFAALAARDGKPPARLLDAMIADTIDCQKGQTGEPRRAIPIPRDSLTPVVQHWLRRDLPATLLPWTTPRDRGVVLDAQWPTLAPSFADVGLSEAEGVAPSLVMTPMLVESGAVAYLSNLDLEAMRQERLRPRRLAEALDRDSVELFDLLPKARHTLSLATAARLNATFPYVSPALSLPTDPPRRVVDAGYFDNFGGDVIAGWLAEPAIMRWICEHCAGVAILQVRAFAPDHKDLPVPGAGARALQGVTSPAEGLLSARAASQIMRSNAQIRLIERLYETHFHDRAQRDPGKTRPDVAGICWPFIRRFTFEAHADTSMSWYVPGREVAALARLLPPAGGFYEDYFARVPDAEHRSLDALRATIAGVLDQLGEFATQARMSG